MRLAICIEEDALRRTLTEELGSLMIHKGLTFSADSYRHVRDLLYELEDGYPVDVVLMGVADASTAADCVEALHASRFFGKLILIGNDDECAVRGYEWGIDGFWRCPVDVVKAVERLETLQKALRQECLLIRCRRAWHHIHHTHIVCVESRNNQCVIHRDDGEPLVVYMRLDDLQAQLHDGRFLRCHQSFLINMDHVRTLDKQFVLTGGVTAAVCQRRIKTVREQYLVYAQRDCVILK